MPNKEIQQHQSGIGLELSLGQRLLYLLHRPQIEVLNFVVAGLEYHISTNLHVIDVLALWLNQPSLPPALSSLM